MVRSGNRAAESVSFDDAVVSFFVDAADMLGVPKSVAAIYGICFASPEPLGFSDINERLDISSGSISQGLRVLRELGALKVAEPSTVDVPSWGDLKHALDAKRAMRYEPELELRKLVVNWIEKRLKHQLKTGSSNLKALFDAVPTSTLTSDILRKRIESLETWQSKTGALIPFIKAYLKIR